MKLGERPAFFSVHVDSYVNIIFICYNILLGRPTPVIMIT